MGQFHEGKDSSEPENQEKLSLLPGIPITGPRRPTGVLWGLGGSPLSPLALAHFALLAADVGFRNSEARILKAQ